VFIWSLLLGKQIPATELDIVGSDQTLAANRDCFLWQESAHENMKLYVKADVVETKNAAFMNEFGRSKKIIQPFPAANNQTSVLLSPPLSLPQMALSHLGEMSARTEGVSFAPASDS
jgi:hypothetical protein